MVSLLSMQSESAVVSITFRPRSIASRCVRRGRNRASGSVAGIAVVDARDAVLCHQDRVGADLERAQRRRGVGREERVARSGGEDDDAVLFEVPDRACGGCTARRPPHLERRLHAGAARPARSSTSWSARAFQQRREHAGVVGGRPFHPLGCGREAAVEVAAADDDRHADAAVPARPRSPRASARTTGTSIP